MVEDRGVQPLQLSRPGKTARHVSTLKDHLDVLIE